MISFSAQGQPRDGYEVSEDGVVIGWVQRIEPGSWDATSAELENRIGLGSRREAVLWLRARSYAVSPPG